MIYRAVRILFLHIYWDVCSCATNDIKTDESRHGAIADGSELLVHRSCSLLL